MWSFSAVGFRRFYGPLFSLVQYAPSSGLEALVERASDGKPSGRKSVSGSGGLVGGLLGRKVACLDDLIGDVDLEVGQRVVLSANVIYRIYQHYCYLMSKLYAMYMFPLSSDRALEMRRSGLETQLDALKQEKRAEQVECFKDVAKLKSERRGWVKERDELALRVDLVFESLGGLGRRG